MSRRIPQLISLAETTWTSKAVLQPSIESPTNVQMNTLPKSIYASIKNKVAWLFGFLILVTIAAFTLHYYSYVFSRKVSGEVIGIDRVIQPSTIIGVTSQVPASQIFSFALAIKEAGGEIVTASSEDRQWAVVEKGQCAEARFFPYPFWELEKSGTYFGARLLKIYDCPK
ncbi:MAG: hypothetical protein HYX41_03905 [Bdellovibrio sp.]|nr:hypothetical protein [Bdellovibrio sp.]